MTELRCIMTHRTDPDRPRRAVDGAYLCTGHLGELWTLVTEMADRADDLDRANGPGGKRSGTGDGITVDLAAAEQRSAMAAIIASWCRVVAEDRGITTPAGPELHRTVPWLERHVDWCAAQPWVDEMLTELRQVAGRAIGLTDIPARRIPLGERCLIHADGERCTGAVTIVIRGDDWSARCPVCQVTQEATPYLRDVRSGRWVSTEGVITLARLFGVDASREVVRQWKHRRKIVGKVEGDVSWYDLASVQTYLARRQKSERMSA